MTFARNLAFVLLALGATAAAPVRSRSATELIAVEHVDAKMRPRATRHGNDFDVQPSLRSTVSDRRDAPVTGGLVVLTTAERPLEGKNAFVNLVRRGLNKLNPYSDTSVVVDVDDNGNAEIIDNPKSFAVLPRLGRRLGHASLVQVLRAAYQTADGSKTATAAVMALGAFLLHPHDPTITHAAAALAGSTATAFFGRLKQLSAAQTTAVEATVKWVNDNATGGYPSPRGAYEHYLEELAKNAPAPQPLTKLQLLRKLGDRGL